MELFDHNLQTLEKMNTRALAQWLETAMRRYFLRQEGVTSFVPCDTIIRQSDGLAQGLEAAFALVTEQTRSRARDALVKIMQSWTAQIPAAWLFLVELAWRLEAQEAIDVLEVRCNPAFIEALIAENDRALSEILALCRDLAPIGNTKAVTLFYRLSLSQHFADSETRATLVRLCEIDPDQWIHHISVLRDPLDRQMRRIALKSGEEAARDFAVELAADIYACVGVERLLSGLADLRPSFWSDEETSDQWFFDAISDPSSPVQCSPDMTLLADRERPNTWRPIPDRQLSPAPSPSPPVTDKAELLLGSAAVPAADLLEFVE